ncbi:hypothetical protein H6P81_018686 [Aristolochia fimbriata]|uniref:Uncharacterized protein n=1 Tax=Aristolochia fimbriata TaxID=158543 RepID=A0AAV7E4U5_ARIFI|nr:hypothetical protein H6P81_018686 [Aristolochia fimbriata]
MLTPISVLRSLVGKGSTGAKFRQTSAELAQPETPLVIQTEENEEGIEIRSSVSNFSRSSIEKESSVSSVSFFRRRRTVKVVDTKKSGRPRYTGTKLRDLQERTRNRATKGGRMIKPRTCRTYASTTTLRRTSEECRVWTGVPWRSQGTLSVRSPRARSSDVLLPASVAETRIDPSEFKEAKRGGEEREVGGED